MSDVSPAVSINIGIIQGGCSASVTAPNYVFEVTVVMPVGLDPHVMFQKANKIVAKYPEAQILLEGTDAADISDPELEITAILQRTVTELGLPEPRLVSDVTISDLRYWRYRRIPGFWYGPDEEDVSAANESVKIEDLLHLVRPYVITSKNCRRVNTNMDVLL
ncbi:hypothetical protein EKO04_007233 [Ascochyta lentis]|uniref:Uncharacterized protein n=1 Tax=Ascochyta lentis TaxID=205686 RepID=A0A8H7MII7_9PLEO|nr:hypothetical protein EKO04_007233 [Ascochyta lentis]